MIGSCVKTTYYGLHGDDYIRAKAEAEMHADAYAEVLRRQSEADRREYDRREADRRKYEYRNSEEYKAKQQSYNQNYNNWEQANHEIWSKISIVVIPNLPANPDETRQVIDYVNTNRAYPAPFNVDENIRGYYQKLIQYRLQGKDMEADVCVARIYDRWRLLVSTAFCAITECPHTATKDNVTRYLKNYLTNIKFWDYAHWASDTPIQNPTRRYTNNHLPIPAHVQAQYDKEVQHRQDVNAEIIRQLTRFYNYMTQYNSELELH